MRPGRVGNVGGRGRVVLVPSRLAGGELLGPRRRCAFNGTSAPLHGNKVGASPLSRGSMLCCGDWCVAMECNCRGPPS